MAISIGLVGLPNSGKTTLFNAITNTSALAASYPFSTTSVNVAIVDLPDNRLDAVARVIKPKSIVPARMSVVDVPGLIENASQGEGLGNQFLSEIRKVDLICMILRYFADADVPHVYSTVDPLRDYSTLQQELSFADMNVVARRIEKTIRRVHADEKTALGELATLRSLREWLNASRFVKDAPESITKSLATMEPMDLLTIKPMLVVINVGENWGITNNTPNELNRLSHLVSSPFTSFLVVCAKLEDELTDLAPDEGQAFRDVVGLGDTNISHILDASYRLLNIVTYFTFGELGLKAWTVPKGTTAPQAAGRVHSDLETRFVKAEVFYWEDLVRTGSVDKLKDKGLIRLEGKDYEVSEGDVMYFRAS